MKSCVRALVAVWIGIVLQTSLLAKPAPQLSGEKVAAAESLARKFMDAHGVPGLSIALAIDDQLVFSRGFGLSDVENQVPATADTVYRTASIAKALTAVAVVQLAERGLIDLDRPLDEYFAAYPKREPPITARLLLGHLAGVRHYKRPGESLMTKHYFDIPSTLKVFDADPLLSKPGAEFHYTTFGFSLLGAIVEQASGQEFTKYLHDSVCTPAQMCATRSDDHFALIPHRARGYMRLEGKPADGAPGFIRHVLKPDTLYNAPLHDTSVKIPGGGMVSTSPDLVRFATAMNCGQLLRPESLRAMWEPQRTLDDKPSQYGLGWRVLKLGDFKVVGHSGGQAGVSTCFLLCPEKHVAAAVMCNLQGLSPQQLCLQLLTEVANFDRKETDMSSDQPNVTGTDYAEVVSRLRDFIESERKAKQLPAVSIALVDGDRIAWSGGFGTLDAEGRQPADGDAIYRVGSVSKLFTDLAVMQLVAQGKVELDADVRKYLPDFSPENPYGTPITVRQLMSHQSGLVREPPVGNYFDPSEPSLADSVKSLNETKLIHKPGTTTKYSNAALAVVGMVVERVSGQSFEEYVQESILRPLKMDVSAFHRNQLIDQRLAHGWMWSQHLERFPAPQCALGTLSAGNLYSSVNELAHLFIMLFNRGQFSGQQIIPADTVELMLRPIPAMGGDPNTYGIGFRLGELDGHRTLGHGGAVYGYATQFTGMPDERIGVAAVLAMDVGNGFAKRLTDYALRLMLAQRAGKPLPTMEMSEALPVETVEKLAGVYVAGENSIELQEYDNSLFLKREYELNEVRATKRGLIIDDIKAYGPEFEVSATGSLKLEGQTWERQETPCPAACPDKWKGLLGEYGWDHNVLYIYEDRGQLWCLIEWFYHYPLTEISENVFAFPTDGLYSNEQIVFSRDDRGQAVEAVAASVAFKRRNLGDSQAGFFRIRPVRPIDELRREALASRPPQETRSFRPPDLVELNKLDPTIQYDIRYASDRNFMGVKFYDSPHAYLQRPAAEALARVQQDLKVTGYGLLIHDAYRPWFVTKMFWDGTPPDLHDFVADPEKGSRHNRGCAVDLTLYELATGKPIEMVGLYDEMSPRSFPLYPGGEGRQRWHRDLLRQAMQRHGFTVYPFEWWHFDYKDWTQYPIVNLQFEKLPPSSP
ncbi:MAG: serine hydrolase [Pirellulales bacterium]